MSFNTRILLIQHKLPLKSSPGFISLISRSYVKSCIPDEIDGNIKQLLYKNDNNLDKIINNKLIKLNSDTLNALLTVCQKTNKNNDSTMAVNIWSKFVFDHNVTPDMASYRLGINLISKNRDKSNQNFVCNLINELKNNFMNDLTHKEWYIIINFYRFYGDANGLLNEYNLISKRGKLSKYILSSMFEGFIKSGQPHNAEYIFTDIINRCYNINKLEQLFDSRNLQSLIVCVGQSGNKISNHFLFDVWSLLVNKLGIKPELCCYCLAIFVLSKSKHLSSLKLCNELLLDLNLDQRMMELLEQNENALYFRQVLAGYGNICKLEEMWSFYNAIKRNNHDDIIAVNVLASSESRLDILKTLVLDGIIRQYIGLDTLSVADLIGFYRMANKCNDEMMKDDIWKLLSNKPGNVIKKNVISRFQLNGMEYIIETGYQLCEFKSMVLVKELMEETNYVIDTLCALELPDHNSRERHLKSHSEKKALAILLRNTTDDEITISVSMRMCLDCHKFFAEISARYDRKINCVDPRGIHSFRHGKCSLCN